MTQVSGRGIFGGGNHHNRRSRRSKKSRVTRSAAAPGLTRVAWCGSPLHQCRVDRETRSHTKVAGAG